MSDGGLLWCCLLQVREKVLAATSLVRLLCLEHGIQHWEPTQFTGNLPCT
uniref:Uncharacterized protein n=1 Tax=Arundo donax TaxID=35708 RepID=A0A0A8Y7Y5_ARUDO